MTGLEKARETAEKIKNEVEDVEGLVPAVSVEHHDQVAVQHFSSIKGLEEVGTDIIPLPFYKLVQPGSTNIAINAEGEDAEPGQFYQADSGTAVDTLRVGIVRAKRMVKEFKGKKTVSLGILGVNLEVMTPFLMNISVSSFSNFGRMMNNLTQRKIDAIWKYPITLSSAKVETKKEIDGELQMVKFWVMDFEVAEKPFDKEELEVMQMVLRDYSGTLDRGLNEVEE